MLYTKSKEHLLQDKKNIEK